MTEEKRKKKRTDLCHILMLWCKQLWQRLKGGRPWHSVSAWSVAAAQEAGLLAVTCCCGCWWWWWWGGVLGPALELVQHNEQQPPTTRLRCDGQGCLWVEVDMGTDRVDFHPHLFFGHKKGQNCNVQTCLIFQKRIPQFNFFLSKTKQNKKSEKQPVSIMWLGLHEKRKRKGNNLPVWSCWSWGWVFCWKKLQ